MFNLLEAIQAGGICTNGVGDFIQIRRLAYGDEFPIKAVILLSGEEFPQEFKLNGAAYGDGVEDDEDLCNV